VLESGQPRAALTMTVWYLKQLSKTTVLCHSVPLCPSLSHVYTEPQ